MKDEESVTKVQKGVSPEEKTFWMSKETRAQEKGLCVRPDHIWVLPANLREKVLEEVHVIVHVRMGQMERNMSQWLLPQMKDMVREFVKACCICTVYEPRPAIKPEQGRFPLKMRPGRIPVW